jgi:hypothetical protein
MIPSLGNVDAKTIQELTDQVAKQTKEIQFMFEGNIDADNIRANSITADLISVSQLSAISANLGSITAGSINGITITGTTITGGTVRTSSSGIRIEMTNNKLVGYDVSGNEMVKIDATATVPTLNVGNVSITDDIYSGTQRVINFGSGSNSAYISRNGASYGNNLVINDRNSIKLSVGSTPTADITISSSTVSITGLTSASIPSHNQAWSTITGTPTTLSGYGITDAAALVHTHSWSDITSGKPTTLSGYGITDGVNTSDVVTSATANKILKLNALGELPCNITGNAFTATTATNVAWSGITSKPTTISTFGITDAYTKSTTDSTFAVNLTYDSGTKNLKLYSNTGATLATVNIAGS